MCCFVDIIDECIKDLSSKEPPTEEFDAPSIEELKEYEAQMYQEYLDSDLN